MVWPRELALFAVATLPLALAQLLPLTSTPPTDASTLQSNDSSLLATDTAPVTSPVMPIDFLSTLEPLETTDDFHMTPVHAVHVRVQSSPPVFDTTTKRFIASFGEGDEAYVALMDGVNTASVEGALMYVQAEGINYNTRAEDQRCQRKNNMRFIVFYDVVIAQTNETLALYQDTADQNEYGPMLPMDEGRCSPIATRGGKDILPKECYYFNGDNGEPNVGPFVGGGSKELDIRAPYPDNYWFSFPNTCPLETWKKKTDKCRAATRKGLCDPDVLPDGVTCTFAYRVLGFVPIDDVVGITSMISNTTGQPYKDFAEFCQAGGVEFKGSEQGEWEESLPFWEEPQDETANAGRAQRVLALYQNLTSGFGASSQIAPEVVQLMLPLPSIEALTSENPPCYKNVEKCSTAYGCRRETYSQLCRVCEVQSDGCVAPPKDWKFPVLKKAVGENGGTGDATSGGSEDGDRASRKKPRVTTSSASEAFVSWMLTLTTTMVAGYYI
ncbi:hypothetical protein Poli38472_014501 [Pythium oligandrum]|uniref:Uncharacterized protein n=1 Tax=Pythium oligandrum TaxID=41045 RepID=A0A8K1CDZ9_PYTOL|nr:hypothetical protein Poli38472_014501 [Pythium oligandrum]|eukprot:TMW61040.1 hypothetical protein Poli38472_014501 [Pythium oligandrum]